MHEKNPASSGDQQAICWMVKSKEEFYFENYRTVTGFSEIILKALTEHGPQLVDDAKQGSNQWLRNVQTYLDAVTDDALDSLRVPEVREGAIASMSDLTELLHQKEDPDPAKERVEGGEMSADVEDVEESGGKGEVRMLYPRTYDCFYKSILKNARMWQRPPHDHCSRCEDYETSFLRTKVLVAALFSKPSDPEHAANEAILVRAGGRTKAHEELRDLEHKLPELTKHVTWFAEQRAYLKRVEDQMEKGEVLLQLDYGGFTDSGNNKVSVWSVTAIAKDRKQEHFDFFFDAANQNTCEGRAGAKKNGQTGIFFLEEMLQKNKVVDCGEDVSIFSRVYPHATKLYFSGDTGNGYRAYEMLEELSRVFALYGYDVELVPLPPGHAWNRSDGRIAHLNTFLRLGKKYTRLFGARMIADLFWHASNAAVAVQRKYMARSHVFFREVRIPDADAVAAAKKNFGAMLTADDVANEKVR